MTGRGFVNPSRIESLRCKLRRVALAAVTLFAIVVVADAQQPQFVVVDPRVEEARQAFEATNYEQTRDLLDGLISRISGGTGDAAQRQTLLAAYELRGRARLVLRDEEGARSDFRTVLSMNPSAALAPQAGPRALEVFDDVRRLTVREVVISVSPADAIVTLGSVRVTDRPATMLLVIGGSYEIAATRGGYRSKAQNLAIVPGTGPLEVPIELEREFATLMVMTAPANVEVLIDGAARGRTEPDPAAAAQAALGASAISKPLLLDNVTAGRHRLEFRRDCYISSEQTLDIERPDDVKVPLVRLTPAVASVAISSDVAGATIFVDDAPRGAPPQTLSDLCQGPHVIEVRTRGGRHVRRLDARAGQQETFVARVRPAFAIVSDSGANAGSVGAPDLRLMTETVFQDSKTVTLFASPATRTQELIAADTLPVDWLAFDTLRRPIAGATKVGELARRGTGGRLAKAFDAQGVAAVARDPAGDRSDMLLILLAPGSAKPDVLKWRVDNPVSVRQAASRMDDIPAITRASIGALAIDVLDVPGAVIASIEPGGAAATASLQPGEAIVSVGTTAVTSAAQLLTLVNAHPSSQPLSLEVRDRAGTSRKVDVTAQRVPRLVEERDQTVLSNVLAVQFASQAYSAPTPLDEVAVRLNLAGALMRVGNWNDATRELEAVIKLAAGGPFAAPVKDAITGSAQYLLGACAEASGDAPGAERAWGVAAQSSSALLTDGAEPIKELAERRLAELRQSRGPAR